MSAFIGVKALLGDLIPIAVSLHYPDSSICVLKGDINVLKRDFPQTYSNLTSCKHNKDNRTFIEYGQDLVASWIYEDYLIEQLTQHGLSIERAGADKNREILAKTNVSSTSDCLVKYNNCSRKLEIMNDYKGYWTKYGSVDLRDDKFEKLRNENAIFLGTAPIDKKYIFLDFSKQIDAEYISSHRPYGGKPAYKIKGIKKLLKDLDYQEIVKDIKGAM